MFVQAEKALLLANLLLGYGLDAWVCSGADAVGQQTWVLTRPSKDVALFWDPSSGGFFLHEHTLKCANILTGLNINQDCQKSAVIKSDS